MKYQNLSTDLKILNWFKEQPSSINNLSEDNYHILEWICFGYRGAESYKNNLIIELLLMGADINQINKNCFSYIFCNFLPLPKQPLNNDVVLQKLFKSNYLEYFKNNNELLKFFINSYKSHDFFDIKKQLLFQNNSNNTLEKLIENFSDTDLSNKNSINFYENILLLLNENTDISLSSIQYTNNKTAFDIIKEKVPNIDICRNLLNQIEIIENYKLLNNNLISKQSTIKTNYILKI